MELLLRYSDMATNLKNFPNVNVSQLEADLNVEFNSLKSGYDNAKTRRLQSYREYKFQPYGNEKKGQSGVVSSTIFDAIEWMSPTLVQPFMATDDFIKLVPEGGNIEDVVTAQVHKELITQQIRKRMPFYQVLSDTFKSLLIQGESYIKLTWSEPTNLIPYAHPVLSAIPASQLRYDWTCRNFLDSRVVTHEEDLSTSDIHKMMDDADGLIEDRLKRALSIQGRNIKTGRLRDEETDQPNWVGEDQDGRTLANSLHLRREQWTEYDMEGDGKTMPIMAVFIEDQLIQVIENPMPKTAQRPPFFAAECVRDPLGNPAMGWAELLSDIQKYQTAIMRMMSDNLNSQQNGLYEVDRTNIDDVGMALLQSAPMGSRVPIPVRKPGTITPLKPNPIAQHAFTVLEILEQQKENRSGFTRYSQGLDSKSLNQTATGITTIVQRSEMRMWEMTLRFAEMVLKPMVRSLIAMNQTFLDKEVLEMQFGLPGYAPLGIEPQPAGGWLEVSKEDLGGYFSVTIDIQSDADKQQKIDNILAYGQYFGQDENADPAAREYMQIEVARLMGLKGMETFLKGRSDGNRGVSLPHGDTGTDGAASEGLQGVEGQPPVSDPMQELLSGGGGFEEPVGGGLEELGQFPEGTPEGMV